MISSFPLYCTTYRQISESLIFHLFTQTSTTSASSSEIREGLHEGAHGQEVRNSENTVRVCLVLNQEQIRRRHQQWNQNFRGAQQRQS